MYFPPLILFVIKKLNRGLVLAVESRKLAIYKRDERKIQWTTVFFIGMIHVAALFAFREDLFSYSGISY